MSLDELVRRAQVWRADQAPLARGLTTGFPALDALLPTQGWPYPALIEVLTDCEGIGALSLWLPALAELSRAQWLIWVAPPHLPYVPALQRHGLDLARLLIVDARPAEAVSTQRSSAREGTEANLWAFEQALRFVDCGASLTWCEAPDSRALRRLQLACEAGVTLGVIFRPARFAATASPAVLRLLLSPAAHATGLDIQILKCRGSLRTQTCHLDLSAYS